MATETVTHYAKSVWTDLTLWAIVVLGAISDPEIQQLLLALGLPAVWVSKGVVVGTLATRIWSAKRPVAFIAPGEIKKVEVQKLPEKVEPKLPEQAA
jgi:hypothetical protein